MDFNEYFGPSIEEFEFKIPEDVRPFDAKVIKPGHTYIGKIFPILISVTKEICWEFAKDGNHKSVLLNHEAIVILSETKGFNKIKFPKGFILYFDGMTKKGPIDSYLILLEGILMQVEPFNRSFESIITPSAHILCFYEKE